LAEDSGQAFNLKLELEVVSTRNRKANCRANIRPHKILDLPNIMKYGCITQQRLSESWSLRAVKVVFCPFYLDVLQVNSYELHMD
jgi:hypothetical protein